MSIIIRFDMGDWSLDGHEKTEPLYVKSTHGSADIAEAYAKACNDTGFVLHKQVACKYDDFQLHKHASKKLGKLGFDLTSITDHDFLTIDDLFRMFMFMVNLGNSSIQMVPVELEDETFFLAGVDGRNFQLGYGVF